MSMDLQAETAAELDSMLSSVLNRANESPRPKGRGFFQNNFSCS